MSLFFEAVELCPDRQSPDIDVPCSPSTTLPGFSPPDALPFTGTAWFWLLVGIAVGAILVGLLALWYRRQANRSDQE
jgi:hypothetical protein